MKLKRDMRRVTRDEKNSAWNQAPSRHPSPVTRRSQSGMALVITVILIAVVTFMALAFLAVSRRERNSVTTTTDTTTAQLAADDALAAAQAQIIANTLAATNPYNFGLLVSTNYITSYGLSPGIASPTNVSYFDDNGNYLPAMANPSEFLQAIANLQYLPRPPVFVQTNANGSTGPLDFRFYLDLNRNGQDEPNGPVPEIAANGQYIHQDGTVGPNNANVLTNFHVGDPEWIGVLQHPDQPYGPNNPFVARYAFVAVPIGNALDLNNIFNQAADPILAGANGIPVNPSPAGAGNDSYLRNQGVGSWEINLAAFLGDLNTNEWLLIQPPSVRSYYYQYQPDQNQGVAFNDARALLAYRYNNNYNTLAPANQLLFNQPPNFQASQVIPYDNIDEYSDGPFQTTPAPIDEINFPANRDDPTRPWAGADNPTNFFDMQDLFDPGKANIGAPSPGNSFTNRLSLAGFSPSTYNRYTYYRLLSQMGVESAPVQNQINLNYSNAQAIFYPNGVLSNITIYPDAETNLVPWTNALQFFTIAADRMLRVYSQEWLEENPSNYLATYGMTANIGNVNFPTNVPTPFGISDIPVWVSNQFVYTPAIQRVLQLAANMYDSVYYYSNNTVTPVGLGYPASLPSVFRPFFNRVTIYDPSDTPVFTNVYICGFSEVKSVNNYDPQFGQP